MVQPLFPISNGTNRAAHVNFALQRGLRLSGDSMLEASGMAGAEESPASAAEVMGVRGDATAGAAAMSS